MLDGKYIVYFSLHHSWNYRWHFYQLLAEGFAKNNNVLYINPPKSILTPIKNIVSKKEKFKTYSVENIDIYQPLLVPFMRFKINYQINKYQLTKELLKKLSFIDISKVLLWTFSPDYCVSLFKILSKVPKIYWTGDGRVILPDEEKLLKTVDYIFAVSKPTYEEKKKIFPSKTYFMPIGCDFKRYSSIANEEIIIPEDISNIPHPIIGYGGAISNRIDWKLVKLLVNYYKDYSFVFVGPIVNCEGFNPIKEFRMFRNVYFLGHKDISIAPYYLNAFDVTILPYIMNDFNCHSNPIKFYEYCSLGKPVVTVNIPTLSEFKDAVYIATTYEEFVSYIAEAVKNISNTEDKLKRIEIARQHSIDVLLDKIGSIIKL